MKAVLVAAMQMTMGEPRGVGAPHEDMKARGPKPGMRMVRLQLVERMLSSLELHGSPAAKFGNAGVARSAYTEAGNCGKKRQHRAVFLVSLLWFPAKKKGSSTALVKYFEALVNL